jgi:hypothetical protein
MKLKILKYFSVLIKLYAQFFCDVSIKIPSEIQVKVNSKGTVITWP